MAHPDLDRLLDFSLRFAQNMLQNRGAFYPFAATLQPDGEIKPVAVHSGEEKPAPQALIERLTSILQGLTSTGESVGTALCYDSRVSVDGDATRKKDAITVALEHVNGEAVLVYMPYSKKFLRGFSYDPLIATRGPRKIFS